MNAAPMPIELPVPERSEARCGEAVPTLLPCIASVFPAILPPYRRASRALYGLGKPT
jgi:hypothetical protein